MNLQDLREVIHLIKGCREKKLIKAILRDGEVVPREVVPTLIDIYKRDSKGVTYAVGCVYGPDDADGISSEVYCIVGRKKRFHRWTWAWVVDSRGAILHAPEAIDEGCFLRIFTSRRCERCNIEDY